MDKIMHTMDFSIKLCKRSPALLLIVFTGNFSIVPKYLYKLLLIISTWNCQHNLQPSTLKKYDLNNALHTNTIDHSMHPYSEPLN
jgi:hypothetical protein